VGDNIQDNDRLILPVIPEYAVGIGPLGLHVGLEHLLTLGSRAGIVLLAVQAVVAGIGLQVVQGFDRSLVFGGVIPALLQDPELLPAGFGEQQFIQGRLP
jgi:hypothetical protein